MYPSFQNKRYVIKVIIIYVLERKITDLKIRGVVYASSKTFGKTEHFLAASCCPTIATRLNAYGRKIRDYILRL